MLIIENISGVTVDINDLGLSLAPNETVDLIIEGDSRDVSASGKTGGDLNTLIASNNIVVKDPLDGVTNLSSAQGIIAVSTHNDPHYRMPVAGRIADAVDVDLSAPGTYLRYNGSIFERRTPAQLADEIESEIDITNLGGYTPSHNPWEITLDDGSGITSIVIESPPDVGGIPQADKITGTTDGNVSFEWNDNLYKFHRNFQLTNYPNTRNDGSTDSALYVSASGLLQHGKITMSHGDLSGVIANEHIDHSTITISAGAGMVGGGDLTASRAFSVGEGIGITVNTNNISVNPAEVNHDNLLGFVANEHIDWTVDQSPLQIVSANMENSHAPNLIENASSGGSVTVDSIGFIKVIASGSTAAEWLSNQLNVYTSIAMSGDAPFIMSGGSSSYLNLREFNPSPQVRFGSGASIGIGAWSDNNLYLNANGKRITSITDVLFDIKTDDIKFSEYPNTRDDGSTSKALYVDATGNLKYGDIAGTGTSVGGVSKVLDSWTLLSGTLYYNDFVHNLGTMNVTMHLRDTATNRLVYPEYTEIVDANTVRTVIEGNTDDLTINVVSGAGPKGDDGLDGLLALADDPNPALGGNLEMDGNSIIAGSTQISQTELSYLNNVTSNVQTQLNSKTTATGHTHTYRIPHTWGISGDIGVANGQTGYLLPMFISLASGQSASLVSCRHRLNAGGTVNFTIYRNGTALTGFTNITASTTATTTDPSNISLASNDMISVEVNSITGSPQNLSLTIFIENTQ